MDLQSIITKNKDQNPYLLILIYNIWYVLFNIHWKKLRWGPMILGLSIVSMKLPCKWKTSSSVGKTVNEW